MRRMQSRCDLATGEFWMPSAHRSHQQQRFMPGIGNGAMSVVSILLGIFLDCLELLVAFIQAFVFTMLSSIYIGLSQVEHHHE